VTYPISGRGVHRDHAWSRRRIVITVPFFAFAFFAPNGLGIALQGAPGLDHRHQSRRLAGARYADQRKPKKPWFAPVDGGARRSHYRESEVALWRGFNPFAPTMKSSNS
jgi:hypothetical protein